jgi:hypothetical protein
MEPFTPALGISEADQDSGKWGKKVADEGYAALGRSGDDLNLALQARSVVEYCGGSW